MSKCRHVSTLLWIQRYSPRCLQGVGAVALQGPHKTGKTLAAAVSGCMEEWQILSVFYADLAQAGGTSMGPLFSTRRRGRSCLPPLMRVCHSSAPLRCVQCCSPVQSLRCCGLAQAAQEVNLLLVDDSSEAQLISATDDAVWGGIRALHHGQPPGQARTLICCSSLHVPMQAR